MSFDPPEPIRQLLRARGVLASDYAAFFAPSIRDLAAPESLPGIEEATDCIRAACAEGRKIVVFGDYDCDGVCATAILVQTLTALGARVAPFIPDRLTEGYGMSEGSVARMLRDNPDAALIVTVDNGINAVAPVADLCAKGLQVVITDHHLPGEELPAAQAIVDPKVEAPAALRDLCGAGVAFLLACSLVRAAQRRGLYSGGSLAAPLVVLAGMATVTDIMPIVGQNRILVAEATRLFATHAPVGLRELYARSARNGYDRFTSRDFAFQLGPRINAAGRVASGMESLELILTKDVEIARELARIVDVRNAERKDVEQRMSEEALALVVPDAPAQVIDLPNGHPGVAGIVASRVLERLNESVPVFVNAGGHGSARAPNGVNVRDAMESCADLLENFGGHSAAGGFSVKPGMMDAFRERICAWCRALPPCVAPTSCEPDVWLAPEEMTLALGEWVQRLEPFGEGNDEPVFGLKGVLLGDAKPLGADGRHLVTTVMTPMHVKAVWWGQGERAAALRADKRPRDILFRLEMSEYGAHHVEMRLVDVL